MPSSSPSSCSSDKRSNYTMNPYDFPFDKPPRKELLGPRPTPLKVRKDSHSIKKPPLPPPQPYRSEQEQRPPVIIYTVSPKVIHTNPNEFMTLVQRLTGSSSSTACTSNNTSSCAAGVVPPAPVVCYTTLEKAIKSPKGETTQESDGDHFQTEMGGGGGGSGGVGEDEDDDDDEYNNRGVVVERRSNLLQGILSPGPSSLQLIQPNFFFSPPPADPNSISSFFHDLSPVPIQHGNKTYIEGSFMSSPSNFFSSNMISPTQSIDLFNNFID